MKTVNANGWRIAEEQSNREDGERKRERRERNQRRYLSAHGDGDVRIAAHRIANDEIDPPPHPDLEETHDILHFS